MMATNFVIFLVSALVPDPSDMQLIPALRDIYNIFFEKMWVPLQTTSVDLSPMGLPKRQDSPLSLPPAFINSFYIIAEPGSWSISFDLLQNILMATRLIKPARGSPLLEQCKQAARGFLKHLKDIQAIEDVYSLYHVSARGKKQLVSILIHSTSIYEYDGEIRDGRNPGLRLIRRYLELKLGGEWTPEKNIRPKEKFTIEVLQDQDVVATFTSKGNFDDCF
jgi:hypothetical protein